MNKSISPKIIALTFGVLVISFLATFYVVAWQEPPYGGVCTTPPCPPGGNVPTPLNVGADYQEKIGPLVINRGGAATGLVVEKGSVGIGTVSPNSRLTLYDDTAGDRPFLTLRHAAGAGGYGADLGINTNVTGDFFISSVIAGTPSKRLTIQRANGNVGIGTPTPAEKLEVLGNIKLSGASPTYRITNLAIPVNDSDAATKGYVDAKLGGGGGGGGALDFYQTAATYNGDQDHLVGVCASGYHMCLSDEMSGRPYNTSLGVAGELDSCSWVDANSNSGASGFGDCLNWASSLFSDYGICANTGNTAPNPWTYSYGASAQCNTQHPVLCCENISPEIGVEQAAATFVNAATFCRSLSGNWHLPSAEELAHYTSATMPATELWTSTPSGSTANYITIVLSSGALGARAVGNSVAYRCIR